MVKPTCNVNNFFVVETRDLLGEFLVICVAMPKLAMITPTEGVHLAILTEGDRVVTPASYFYYAYTLADVLHNLGRPSVRIG